MKKVLANKLATNKNITKQIKKRANTLTEHHHTFYK